MIGEWSVVVVDVQQKVLSRWINWQLHTVVIQQPDNLVDQLRDGDVLSTLLSTVTQGDFRPVSQPVCIIS